MTSPFPAPPSDPSDRLDIGYHGPRSGDIAPLGLRIGARLFDELVMAIPMVIVAIPYIDIGSNPPEIDLPAWGMLVTVVLPVVYEFVAVAWKGATFGKALCRLRVIRVDGGRVAPYQAGLRSLVPALGSILALAMPPGDGADLVGLLSTVVYLSVFWDALRRGLHDKAAGTGVVRA